MITNEKVARRKLSLLELAKELNNVSKACKLIGYSRQQFYEIRRNYQTYGAEGLLDKLPGCKGAHPNRVAPEIEQAILDYSLTRPTHGPLRVAQELALQGINVSAGGVRGVWQRHDLLSKRDRLLRLEKTHREQTIELNDEQIRLLERFSPEFREHQIEVHYTGELVAVDTFFVGALKGVGKVYLQTVLPFFEAHEARVYTILSDNGREFCGRPDHHPYELFLQLEGIEHRTTKVRRPQNNGFIERLHRTLLDEHFLIKGRTTWYESVEQMQTELDSDLEHYNTQRPHQDRMMEGQTPYRMFKKGLKLIPKKVRTKVA
ncbi:IS481 family transposase [Aeromonas veronii]|uniref:IS481 family transposase n=1 Tax=Aeromonas veronii TaxID=654 RepID=UPI0031FCB82E